MKLSEFDFAAQQYWLRKMLEVLYMRRSTMFRFVVESARMLILGNGGGVATTFGMLNYLDLVGVYHWVCVFMLLTFVLGTLFSTVTLILVTATTIREAHSAEIAMHEFVNDRMDRDEVLFYYDETARRLAYYSTCAGIVSISLLVLGAVQGLFLVAVYL
ncbi:MAG: hypothetical protein OXI60_03650 [Acidiferrobacterales bacterium]|nr:hypothetical protein [Acidiferrobacterales bacterium]